MLPKLLSSLLSTLLIFLLASLPKIVVFSSLFLTPLYHPPYLLLLSTHSYSSLLSNSSLLNSSYSPSLFLLLGCCLLSISTILASTRSIRSLFCCNKLPNYLNIAFMLFLGSLEELDSSSFFIELIIYIYIYISHEFSSPFWWNKSNKNQKD